MREVGVERRRSEQPQRCGAPAGDLQRRHPDQQHHAHDHDRVAGWLAEEARHDQQEGRNDQKCGMHELLSRVHAPLSFRLQSTQNTGTLEPQQCQSDQG